MPFADAAGIGHAARSTPARSRDASNRSGAEPSTFPFVSGKSFSGGAFSSRRFKKASTSATITAPSSNDTASFPGDHHAALTAGAP